MQINLNEIPGTGKDGRVLKEDIFKFLEDESVRRQGNLILILCLWCVMLLGLCIKSGNGKVTECLPLGTHKAHYTEQYF